MLLDQNQISLIWVELKTLNFYKT